MKNHIFTSAIAALLFTGAADASHNRGSVLIPSIDANGVLTVEATSFWRTSSVDRVRRVTITPPGASGTNFNMTQTTTDTSDTRFTRTVTTTSTTLSGGAGLYTISWGSCCRVAGAQGTNSGANMGTTSTIYWDGQSATKPITFDILNIQPNVLRNASYSDNLDATSDDGDMLTFDDSVLTTGITSQAPGYAIDGTGQITIDAASTAGYTDNSNSRNVGADVAFAGQINASDGTRQTGSVQFDWMFDGTDSATNQPPTVQDVVINATAGSTINQLITADDPNSGDTVTLSFLGFTGPGGSIAGSTFVPGMSVNPADGTFSWDSTGFAAGTYIATFGATDGSLTDQGTLTINLTDGGGMTPVPLPAGIVLLGTALVGFGVAGRRRRKD